MSAFDAALRRGGPSVPVGSKVKRKVVEVWEVERWKLGEGWTEGTWCDEEGVAQSVTRAEMRPPPGYAWESDWKIVPPESPDGSVPWQGFGAWGWEYATSTKKLGARAPRKGFAFDRARRRRWQRAAVKKPAGTTSTFSASSAASSSSTSLNQQQQQQQQHHNRYGGGGSVGGAPFPPRNNAPLQSDADRTALVRRQLEQVQRLRRQVEARAKLCGTPQDSLELRRELDDAAMRAGRLSADVGKLLDSSVAAPLGSKLSRDLYKEVAAVAAVVRSLPPPPRQRAKVVASSGGGGGGVASNNVRDRDARRRNPGGPDDPAVLTGRGSLASGPSHERRLQQIQLRKSNLLGLDDADDHREEQKREPPQLTAEEEEARRIANKVRSVSEQAVINSIEQETHTAVQEVHDSILAINDIVKDLATQVESQQDMIDTIEVNTTKAHHRVQGAKDQVVQAAEIQSQTPCIIS